MTPPIATEKHKDHRTQAEITYDSIKDGSAYVRQAVAPVDEEAQVTGLLDGMRLGRRVA